ncbi:AraC family transcriptional regulator [Azospirillum sp. SYSU D00513]|uniref:helix-turn-helix transcriptional regulator n=1 Tax=Azospirillum sp. SYSU D00513 TaxID=2812561 RepID=UPI001A97278D|nr:AraC family transcriptional regulator [Azospirillum sp. SYSU D00513]
MAKAAESNLDLRFIPLPEKPAVIRRDIGRGTVGIARLRCDTGGLGMLDTPALEDAFLISHHLSSFRSEIWVDGKPVPRPPNLAGHTTIHDFRRNIACRMHTAFDTLVIHLPRAMLEEILPDGGPQQFEDIAVKPSECIEDPTIAAIVAAMLPALDVPERIGLMYLDHVSCALATHLVAAYGQVTAARSGGTLAPWQERRVKEMIAARLDGDIRLADLAAECRLSVGHFVRAFRRTTNITPYQWLLQRRVDHAKELMRDGTRTLGDVALDCGFADQSHFTRTFSRFAGVSPGVWRHRNAAA